MAGPRRCIRASAWASSRWTSSPAPFGVDGEALKLSPLEQTLLYLFLANPGDVLSRESVLTNIWGTDSALTSNVIDRHIRDLRVKLRETWRQPRFIETVPGEGYRYIGSADIAAA